MSRELKERNQKAYRYRMVNHLSYSEIGKLIKKSGEKPLDKAAVCRIIKREEAKLKLKIVDN